MKNELLSYVNARLPLLFEDYGAHVVDSQSDGQNSLIVLELTEYDYDLSKIEVSFS
jgi:hypothetical protein